MSLSGWEAGSGTACYARPVDLTFSPWHPDIHDIQVLYAPATPTDNIEASTSIDHWSWTTKNRAAWPGASMISDPGHRQAAVLAMMPVVVAGRGDLCQNKVAGVKG